jgi:hypothetical protein
MISCSMNAGSRKTLEAASYFTETGPAPGGAGRSCKPEYADTEVAARVADPDARSA